MIYFPDKNIAIITPPHTASGNLHKTLCSADYGGQWVVGPCLYTGNINHHYCKIPTGWKHEGCKIVVVVRDPYDRLIGLYRHYEWWLKENEIENIKTFNQYVLERPDSWIDNKTITDFLSDNGVEEYTTIKYESIEDDLNRLVSTKVDLLPRYHKPNVILEWYCQDEVINEVNSGWANKDCENFGYKVLKCSSV